MPQQALQFAKGWRFVLAARDAGAFAEGAEYPSRERHIRFSHGRVVREDEKKQSQSNAFWRIRQPREVHFPTLPFTIFTGRLIVASVPFCKNRDGKRTLSDTRKTRALTIVTTLLQSLQPLSIDKVNRDRTAQFKSI